MRIFAGWFVMLCVFFGVCAAIACAYADQQLHTRLLVRGPENPAVTLAEIRNQMSSFDASLKWFLLACGVAIWLQVDRACELLQRLTPSVPSDSRPTRPS